MTEAQIKAREIVMKFQLVAMDKPMMFEDAKNCGMIAVAQVLHNIDATILYHKDSLAILINKSYWLAVQKAMLEL